MKLVSPNNVTLRAGIKMRPTLGSVGLSNSLDCVFQPIIVYRGLFHRVHARILPAGRPELLKKRQYPWDDIE
jgi:hypothetical protein